MKNYYTAARRVLTSIFWQKASHGICDFSWKNSGSRRLIFSTIIPEQLQIFCAWQEKAPLNQTGSAWMDFIQLLLYSFRWNRWNIEVSYYEQKIFWSLCSYIVRSRKGIEMLVNLINITYCAMKLLPYLGKTFSEYRAESVQELL